MWPLFDRFVVNSRQDEALIWLKVVYIYSATVFKQFWAVICPLSFNYMLQISLLPFGGFTRNIFFEKDIYGHFYLAIIKFIQRESRT